MQTGRVILVVGRIASGKTTWARQRIAQEGGVLLSCDELMLALFGPDAGTAHDALAARVRAFLLQKSLELLRQGIDVYLDWGFWRRADRDAARAFYTSRHIPCRLQVLQPPDDVWQACIRRRNDDVRTGKTSAYFVDTGLLRKCLQLYEEPAPDEMTP